MNRFESRPSWRITLLAIAGILAIVLPVAGNWNILQERDPEVRDYMSVVFTSEKNGWTVGVSPFELDYPGFIGYTTDGGATWNRAEIDIKDQLTSLYFLDDKHGWAIGENGMIAATTNGRDWELQTSKVGNGLNGIYFVNKDVGFAVGANDTILSTTTGGRSWKIVQGGVLGAVGDDEATMYSAIQFINESTGWVAGVHVVPQVSQSSVIQKTVDGGQTWEAQETGAEDVLQDIFFLDDKHGWAVGENGLILHTSNGGGRWATQMSNTEETLRSIRFADKYMGWAVGGELGVGVIVHTNNGGKDWEVQDLGGLKAGMLEVGKIRLNSVFILGKQVWLTGGNGVILQGK